MNGQDVRTKMRSQIWFNINLNRIRFLVANISSPAAVRATSNRSTCPAIRTAMLWTKSSSRHPVSISDCTIYRVRPFMCATRATLPTTRRRPVPRRAPPSLCTPSTNTSSVRHHHHHRHRSRYTTPIHPFISIFTSTICQPTASLPPTRRPPLAQHPIS